MIFPEPLRAVQPESWPVRSIDGMDKLPPRVVATAAALSLLEHLQDRYGKLLFFQSNGCCDGSTPMCYAQSDFLISDADICLGRIGSVPFYMSPEQFAYWQSSQIILDAADGRGGMFSLDSGTGKRFLTRSRLFSDEESAALALRGLPFVS